LSPFVFDSGSYKAYWELYAPQVIAQFGHAVVRILNQPSELKRVQVARERLLSGDLDDQSRSAFRGLTNEMHISSKLENLQILFSLLDRATRKQKLNPDDNVELEVSVPETDAVAVCQALNDIHTFLGQQLGIESVTDAQKVDEHLNELLSGDTQLSDLPITLAQNAMLAGTYFAVGVALNSLEEAMTDR